MDISVIIPVYNAATLVSRAVQSVLPQKQVKEIILVEDGSADDSLFICQGLQLEDSRVKLFQHPDQQNHGAGASRNLGVQKATCPYIAFLDADDFFCKNRFGRTQQIFEQYALADGVYEATERIFEHERARNAYFDLYNDRTIVSVDRPVAPADLFSLLFLGNEGWFHLNGLVIKRAVFEKTQGFDLQLRQTQDTDFILRLALHTQLYSSDEKTPVAKISIHGENRILNEEKVIYYRHLFFKKWLKRMLKNQWNVRVNQHIIRGLLYTHPFIFKYRKFILIRFPIKLICILGYILRSPSILFKLF